MPSGRPDWFGTIVSAGKYDDTYVPIAVDVNGAILALMKGTYGETVKTIAVDSDGVMKANLTTQDLDFLSVRPVYGEAAIAASSQTVAASSSHTAVDVDGRGAILCGQIRWEGTASRKAGQINLKIDGSSFDTVRPGTIVDYDYFGPLDGPMFLRRYDDDNFRYAVGLTPHITFESNLTIELVNPYGALDIDYVWEIVYMLVP